MFKAPSLLLERFKKLFRIYLTCTYIEELLSLYRYSFLSFLAQDGRLISALGSRENAGFKNQKELRTAWATNSISALGVFNIQIETGTVYRAAEINLVTQFIRFWDKKADRLGVDRLSCTLTKTNPI